MAEPKSSSSDAASSSSQRLFHSSLSQIPSPLRFALSGILGNVLFVILYNASLAQFQSLYEPSTIYAVVQFACIVVNHALNCGLVFGWPTQYTISLAQNLPVGLSALLLGTVTIQYLDYIEFDDKIMTLLGQSIDTVLVVEEQDNNKGGFYASLVVMTVTGLYSYVLLSIVNKPSSDTKKEKEL